MTVVAWFSTELELLREFAEIEEASDMERATLAQVLVELEVVRERLDRLEPPQGPGVTRSGDGPPTSA